MPRLFLQSVQTLKYTRNTPTRSFALDLKPVPPPDMEEWFNRFEAFPSTVVDVFIERQHGIPFERQPPKKQLVITDGLDWLYEEGKKDANADPKIIHPSYYEAAVYQLTQDPEPIELDCTAGHRILHAVFFLSVLDMQVELDSVISSIDHIDLDDEGRLRKFTKEIQSTCTYIDKKVNSFQCLTNQEKIWRFELLLPATTTFFNRVKHPLVLKTKDAYFRELGKLKNHPHAQGMIEEYNQSHRPSTNAPLLK